jgi:hypothetical protein
MTDTPYPDWATDADLDATDRALDALARRDPAPPDPTLHALALLARHVDERAAAQTNHAAVIPGHRGPVTPLDHHGNHRMVRSGTPPQAGRSGPGRRPRRLRLLALPLVALLAVTITVATAASASSPTAPLYPLHQLLFHQPSPPAADAVRQQLASAQQALDRAGNSSGANRLAALADARDHLTKARDLMPTVTNPDDRDELDDQLSAMDHQAKQLAGGDDGEHDSNRQRQTDDPTPRGTEQHDDPNGHNREQPTSPPSATAGTGHRD